MTRTKINGKFDEIRRIPSMILEYARNRVEHHFIQFPVRGRMSLKFQIGHKLHKIGKGSVFLEIVEHGLNVINDHSLREEVALRFFSSSPCHFTTRVLDLEDGPGDFFQAEDHFPRINDARQPTLVAGVLKKIKKIIESSRQPAGRLYRPRVFSRFPVGGREDYEILRLNPSKRITIKQLFYLKSVFHGNSLPQRG